MLDIEGLKAAYARARLVGDESDIRCPGMQDGCCIKFQGYVTGSKAMPGYAYMVPAVVLGAGRPWVEGDRQFCSDIGFGGLLDWYCKKGEYVADRSLYCVSDGRLDVYLAHGHTSLSYLLLGAFGYEIEFAMYLDVPGEMMLTDVSYGADSVVVSYTIDSEEGSLRLNAPGYSLDLPEKSY